MGWVDRTWQACQDLLLFQKISLLNSRGAVESGDGVTVVLGMLEEFDNIISGDNTDGNIAGSDHFGREGGNGIEVMMGTEEEL